MRRSGLIVAVCTVVACGGKGPVHRAPSDIDPAGGPTKSTLDPERRARLLAAMPAVEEYVEDKVAEYEFPALVVGVVAGGELVWSHTHGNATEETVFRIGSITKTITGVAVLQLRDDGKLNLDDPAEHFLPELRDLRYPTTDSPRITVRHLLTHTSGIGMNTRVDYWSRPRHPLTEDELFDVLDGFELVHVPGTETVYSNIGMGLAGLIVQRVSGKRYRDYVDEEILRPLGMTHTVWDREDVPKQRLATGSHRVEDMRVAEHHWRLGAIEGMGGLYSNLRDMSKYVAWQLAAWPPRDDPDYGPLPRATVRESHMLGGHSVPGHSSYGLAWKVRSDRELGHVVSHTGGTFQYAAAVWLLTEHDIGVILMTNDGYGLDKVDGMAHAVASIVARADEQ